MNRNTAFRAAGLFAVAAFLGPAMPAGAQPEAPRPQGTSTIEHVDVDRGQRMEYILLTPPGFAPDKPYPTMLLLSGGPQNTTTATRAMQFVDPIARERGWVVVAPATPDGKLFFQEGAAHVWPLLSAVRRRVTVEGGRFHAVGVSNGGLAAFRLAIDRPENFLSVTTLPGHAPTREDLGRLSRLKGLTVRMFVGSDDKVEWKDESRRTADALKRAGVDVELSVRPAQGHVMADLAGAALLDVVETGRTKEGTMTTSAADAADVLDRFHQAAARADGAAYFALFAPEGVFIGTDATERWTVEQFKAYANPIFSKGKGWTYTPRGRNVEVSPDGGVAWFDEALENEKYGTCRGTGVLRRIDGQWRIAQYHLTVPVPNDLLERVVKMIKADEAKKKAR